MIFDNLDNLRFYSAMNPFMPAVCRFLEENDLDSLSEGWHAITEKGENAYLMVATENLRNNEDADLEGHRKYVDIQICLRGKDRIGWRALATCADWIAEYEPEDDLMFCEAEPQQWIDLEPGYFLMLFPEDLHKPLIGQGEVRKLVVKIRTTPEDGSDSAGTSI